MKKVALVSSIQPETHYTRYLAQAIQNKYGDKVKLILYVDRDAKNKKISTPIENINLVWSKGFLYPFQILKQAIHDKPSVIHLQQEMNMYGSPATAAVFPILLLLLKLLRIKTAVTFHAVVSPSEIDNEFLQTFFLPQTVFYKYAMKVFFWYLYRTSLFLADHIVVHSQFAKNILVKNYGAKKNKVSSVPIGVPESPLKKIDARVFSDIMREKLKDTKIILFFGYLLRRKGIEYLIEAFNVLKNDLPKYQLVIAGGILEYQKEYAESLKALTLKLHIEDRVIFTSFLSQEQMEMLYATSEFIVLPYTHSISSSLPLSFAIQYHKPAIITDIGSLREEIQDGKEGLYCKPKDVKSLTVAIKILATDQKRYATLQKGMEELHTKRTWQHTAKQTVNVYSKL